MTQASSIPDAPPVAPPVAEAPAAPRPRISRRALIRNWITAATLATVGTGYTREIEPFWLDEHDVPMPMSNLPASFDGYRIIQLTDLHASENVPLDYLQSVVARTNARRPDLVVITGDLVTHAIEWVKPICDVLAGLKAPVIVSFGNHDYDVSSIPMGLPTRVADALEAHLRGHGMTVLRNRSTAITHADGRLWFVGLEDLWSGRFAPEVAFAGLDPGEPTICLSHNPDTAPALDAYGPQWILSGHTHGGQVRLPGVGALLVNVQHREFQEGRFQLPHSTLYVSRGVGYLKKVRFLCRPEVPCFVLKRN